MDLNQSQSDALVFNTALYPFLLSLGDPLILVDAIAVGRPRVVAVSGGLVTYEVTDPSSTDDQAGGALRLTLGPDRLPTRMEVPSGGKSESVTYDRWGRDAPIVAPAQGAVDFWN